MDGLDKILEFLSIVGKLKSTYRFNHLDNFKDNISQHESSADHSWRLALMTFLLIDELKLKLNVEHSLKLALIHDIAEAITGDYDAYEVNQGIRKREDKDEGEIKAMKFIKNKFSDNLGKEIFDLWKESTELKTEESRFVKALDRLETQIQIVDADYKNIDNSNFSMSYADKAVNDFPELKILLGKIKQKFKEMYKKKNIILNEEYYDV